MPLYHSLSIGAPESRILQMYDLYGHPTGSPSTRMVWRSWDRLLLSSCCGDSMNFSKASFLRPLCFESEIDGFDGLLRILPLDSVEELFRFNLWYEVDLIIFCMQCVI